MADKNWQAGSNGARPAPAAVWALMTILPFGTAYGASLNFTPPNFVGGADPVMLWQMLIGGLVVLSFLAAVVLWSMSALRKIKRAELRRNVFVSTALNNLGQGIVMIGADNKVVFCNERYLEIYGLKRSDIRKGMTGRELAALREERGMLGAKIDEFYEKTAAPGGHVFELPGDRFVTAKVHRLPNGGSVSTHEECTEERRLARQLASSKNFLELVVDHIPISVTVESVSDRRYLLANRRAEAILNRSREDATGLTAADIFNPREASLIANRDNAAIRVGGMQTEEHPISTKDGLRLFLTRRVTVNDDSGTPQYLIKTHEDVTDRRQTESRMAHMAYHDGLTDLPNRAAFLQALTQMIEACAGTEEEFAVLSVDLDGLKEVNDVFGHAIGDKLLIEVSRRIEASARGGVVARLSGDEFGLIIDGAQPETGLALAERLTKAVSDEFVIDEKSVRTGLTIGIALYPRDGKDAASLLANSGATLFRAKAHSRGSVGVFEPEMDRQIRDRRLLHQELSVAIRNGELSLYYQPLAKAGHDTNGDDVVGFEALARWIHPVRGFVPPSEFIPLAEESGLIVEMGAWILREACREAASWPKPLQIAVNLSPAQFMHGDVVSLLHSILLETGLAPSRLELEITEGVLIEDFDRGLGLLRRLKALGVRISMDDFGSGYSSLTYLQAFPFDKIKIDRAFVMNLGITPQSAAIVRAVINLGHGLGVAIVAEGVETQEQLRFLADEACDVVQGYLIGKPAPIAHYSTLVGLPGRQPTPFVRRAS